MTTSLPGRPTRIGVRVRSDLSWALTDDAALMAGVAGDEEGAFAEVYGRHGQALYVVAVRILRARHPAEDMVHDVLVRLWEHPARFDATRGPLGAYLGTQLRSRCIDTIRAETSRTAREGLAGRQPVPPTVAMEMVIEQEETLGELRDALAVLHPRERATIQLAFLAGLTHVEVASVLNLPLGTVKARIRRGLERLRRLPSLSMPQAEYEGVRLSGAGNKVPASPEEWCVRVAIRSGWMISGNPPARPESRKKTMEKMRHDLSLEEMESQHAVELPARDLMLAVTVLGIPVVGLQGIQLSLNIS